MATCTVTISEYDGIGRFILNLSWEPLIEFPIITGLLDRWSAAWMVFLHYANLRRHRTSCRIRRRCANRMETYGDVTVHIVYGYSDLDINIISNSSDPLHFSGNLNAIIPGGVFPTFSVTEDDSIAFDGVWYLNGKVIGTGASVGLFEQELYSMLFDESYRLDFIGFSLDGKRAGAARGIVVRVEPIPLPEP